MSFKYYLTFFKTLSQLIFTSESAENRKTAYFFSQLIFLQRKTIINFYFKILASTF
jgi:hypothetical protein